MSGPGETELNNDLIRLPDEWADWTITEHLGTGSFGTVYVAEKDGMERAVKVIRVPSDESERAALLVESKTEEAARLYLKDLVGNYMAEINTMYSLQENSHIVQIEDHLVVELEPFGYDIYIRMELLIPMRESFAGRVPSEKETVQVGLDICDALIDCDKHQIIHRDIKPDNIFVAEDGSYKLGDFGTARQLDVTFGTYSAKGTFSFMAPEVYRGERYNKQVDIYSLGIVLYRMMNRNKDPFIDPEKPMVYYQEREEAIKRRMDGEPIPAPVDASPAFTSVILKACEPSAKDRYPDAERFRKDLERVLTTDRPDLELTNRGIGARERHRKRKKRLILVLILLALAACVSGYYFFYVLPRKVVIVSSEDVRIAAEELIDHMVEDAGKANREKFAGYFRDTNDDTVNEYYSDFTRLGKYPGRYIGVLSDNISDDSQQSGGESDELSYFVNVIFYDPQNATDNGEVDGIWHTIFMTWEDGAWKLDGNPEKMEAARNILRESEAFPEDYRVVLENGGHNFAMEAPDDYMFFDEKAAYDNLIVYNGKFMWQNEDGSLGFTIWLANGKDQAVYFGDADVTITDLPGGTIYYNSNLPLNTWIQPGENRMLEFKVPAEEVVTGEREWNDVTPTVKLNEDPKEILFSGSGMEGSEA